MPERPHKLEEEWAPNEQSGGESLLPITLFLVPYSKKAVPGLMHAYWVSAVIARMKLKLEAGFL
jgi:hypothetical protein